MHIAEYLWQKTHNFPFSYIFIQYSPAFDRYNERNRHLLLSCTYEISNQQDVCNESTELGERVGPPLCIVELDASEAEKGTDNTHQGTASYET